MTIGAGIALATLAACGGGGGPSYDPESPEGMAYEYRQAVMRLAQSKMMLITQMAREQIPLDEAAFVQATADIAALARMMPAGFDNETLVAESLTEPSVFEDRADFDRRMNALIQATDALAEAAESGGFEGARGLVTASIGTFSNCGGCHSSYRQDEEE